MPKDDQQQSKQEMTFGRPPSFSNEYILFKGDSQTPLAIISSDKGKEFGLCRLGDLLGLGKICS